MVRFDYSTVFVKNCLIRHTEMSTSQCLPPIALDHLRPNSEVHCYIDSAAKPQIELESRSGEKRPAMHVSQPDPMIK